METKVWKALVYTTITFHVLPCTVLLTLPSFSKEDKNSLHLSGKHKTIIFVSEKKILATSYGSIIKSLCNQRHSMSI